jgi:DNA-binding FrmR family transcriptional regulator
VGSDFPRSERLLRPVAPDFDERYDDARYAERQIERINKMREIKESDWKVLRQLHAVALEHFCQAVLTDSLRLHIAPNQTARQRYQTLYEHFHERDKELARLFDDMRRSQAFRIIAGLRRSGWLTEEEFARFSEETRSRC